MARGPQVPPVHSIIPEEIQIYVGRTNEFSAEPGGVYLHWDQLRHRQPPTGIGHEQWWRITKLIRHTKRQPLTLLGPDGSPATFANTDSVQRGCMRCDQRLAGAILVPDLPHGATRTHVARSAIEEAIASSQLEGASTTRAQALELLGAKRTPRNAHESMIVGNYLAMEWVRANAKTDLTHDGLLHLHRIVMHEGPHGGRLRTRTDNVLVSDADDNTLHVPPPAEDLPARLARMLDFANASSDAPGQFLHPVVRAILLHFWIAYEHPFVDGNGRTARALFHWSMRRQGYWLTDHVSISRVIKLARVQYDRAFLYCETDGLDVTYFVLHQLKVIERAFELLAQDLERDAARLHQLESTVRTSDLNARQRHLVASALREPQATTVAQHAAYHRVAIGTARTDLIDLVSRGYFAQYTEGKRRQVFQPVRDLKARLKAPPKRR